MTLDLTKNGPLDRERIISRLGEAQAFASQTNSKVAAQRAWDAADCMRELLAARAALEAATEAAEAWHNARCIGIQGRSCCGLCERTQVLRAALASYREVAGARQKNEQASSPQEGT